MADFENIIYEVENGRARITLNRPEKLNALSNDLLYELHEALWEADDNRERTLRHHQGRGTMLFRGLRPDRATTEIRSVAGAQRGQPLPRRAIGRR